MWNMMGNVAESLDLVVGEIAKPDDEWLPLEGLLYKYTNVMKGWQYRWFILDPESGRLEYFEKEEQKKTTRPRGSVFLAGAVISPSDEDSQTFTVNAANGEIYRLRAFDAKERQHWVNRLRATAEHHTDSIAQNAPPLTKENRPANFGSQYSLQSQKHNGSTDNIYANATVLPNSRSSPQQKTKRKKRGTHKAAAPGPPQHVSESFKQVKEVLSQVQNHEAALAQQIQELPPSGEHINSLDKEMLLLKATSNATLQCLEQCLNILQQQQQYQQQKVMASGQHSSSGTIEWLDPKHVPGTQSNRIITSPVSPADSFVSTTSVLESKPPEVVKINHDEEVQDEEEYSDTDLGAVEEHKSVILHLLSQLKLGMDLTKVVLPTFILEKRSLLEMFADCMAHPDLFLKIPDQESAEARMMTVVEWYLTSFHASRKGSVAKKPYNPIIGETFHCSWEVPPNKQQTDPTAQSSHRLYYLAEQVSHHPPISAFYFECPDKKVAMNASVWTKSKFMGMSIGVVMVGKVSLKLLALDEEYVFTLPSAYARSILTVPWVEMGDRVTLTCSKTGYGAAITFHTKPFYGGKLHRVTAEVKNPAGEIFCRVNGEWNGKLEFTFTNGTSKHIDTTNMKTINKLVRPIDKQGDFESRRLWNKVTSSLKTGDIDSATEHKRFLEERQRQAERRRKETNTRFPTKFFHEVSDANWEYNSPLKVNQTEPSI